MDNNSSKNLLPRAIRKPLVEKERRKRINESMEEIEQFILEEERLTGNYARTKLQRAETMEMAVDYIKRKIAKPQRDMFVAGYQQCLNNLKDYLANQSTDDVRPETSETMVRLLESKAPSPSPQPPPSASSSSSAAASSSASTASSSSSSAAASSSASTASSSSSNVSADIRVPAVAGPSTTLVARPANQVPENEAPKAAPPNWRPW